MVAVWDKSGVEPVLTGWRCPRPPVFERVIREELLRRERIEALHHKVDEYTAIANNCMYADESKAFAERAESCAAQIKKLKAECREFARKHKDKAETLKGGGNYG